jgi:hypothetical protein
LLGNIFFKLRINAPTANAVSSTVLSCQPFILYSEHCTRKRQNKRKSIGEWLNGKLKAKNPSKHEQFALRLTGSVTASVFFDSQTN